MQVCSVPQSRDRAHSWKDPYHLVESNWIAMTYEQVIAQHFMDGLS